MQSFGDPSDSYLFLQALRAAKEESMKEFQQVDQGRQRLEKRLAKFSLVVNPDTDDTGDCQFDASADQLNLQRKQGEAKISKEEVRRRVIHWLGENGDYKLSEDEGNVDTLQTWVKETQGLEWQEYLEHMSKAKVWGDEVTLRGLVEAFQVEILVFSSTVSEDNYFSQHKPREETSKRLLLCHFLEIHYGSLLSQEQHLKLESAKRAELLRFLPLCSKRQQLQALHDILIKDNFQPEASVPLISQQMIADAMRNNGAVSAFENLAALIAPQVRIKPERVAEIRKKAEQEHPEQSEVQKLRVRNAELEEQLAQALSLIDSLQGEKEEQERNAEDQLQASYLQDEDGKYWINVEWDLTKSTQPRAGDIVSVHSEGSDKPVQRFPTTASGLRGAALFDVPKKIGHYLARYSRRGKVISESEVFLAGPDVRLRAEHEGVLMEVHYEFARGSSSTYDWVGLYKQGSDPSAYITYHYVKPSRSYVTFKGIKPGTNYTVRYFSGESKHFPVAELEVQVT